MPYAPAIGDALLMALEDGDEEHMFVIIASANVGKVGHSFLLVNFTSVKPDCYVDPACVVPGGRKFHDFLRNESFVAYRFAVIKSASELASKVDKGIFKLLARASDDLSPKFHPVESRVRSSFGPIRSGVATGRGAKPSGERSASACCGTEALRAA
jgi:hypothetical protein